MGRAASCSGCRRPRDLPRAVLFPELTVAENVFINNQPLTRLGTVDYRGMERRDDALRRLGARVDVRRMKGADRRRPADGRNRRALVGSVKVLILDEPTAVISGREVELLFERLVALRSAGVAIIYISHRLEEIFKIADGSPSSRTGFASVPAPFPTSVATS